MKNAIAPTVTMSPTSQFAGTDRAAKVYTVSVRNNDMNCGTTDFALSPSAPAGFSAALGATSLAIVAGSTASTALTLTPLSGTAQGSYTFSVMANFTGHESANASGSYILDLTAPSVVANLSATLNRKGVTTLSWGSSTDSGESGLNNYRIYRNGTLLGSTTATTFSRSGLSVGVTYSFQITAVDKALNESEPCNTAQVTVAGSGGKRKWTHDKNKRALMALTRESNVMVHTLRAAKGPPYAPHIYKKNDRGNIPRRRLRQRYFNILGSSCKKQTIYSRAAGDQIA
ncbi:MAG: hypothetical protein IT292_05275 [Deltaproteobacteria bacterium]|nr:hypothetical protein [Deltaproteobacteria bacterium]